MVEPKAFLIYTSSIRIAKPVLSRLNCNNLFMKPDQMLFSIFPGRFADRHPPSPLPDRDRRPDALPPQTTPHKSISADYRSSSNRGPGDTAQEYRAPLPLP